MLISRRVRQGAIAGLILAAACPYAFSKLKAGAPIPPQTLSAAATAQFGGGFGGGAIMDSSPEFDPRLHVQAPISAAAARVWEALDQPLAMPFANETPLEEVLGYIKQSTASDERVGIPIYVDPIGLVEAERTMASPVVMELEGVPLRTTLALALRQLGLAYEVHPEGLLVIVCANSEDAPLIDPSLRILDEVRQLREEIRELKATLRPPAARSESGFQ